MKFTCSVSDLKKALANTCRAVPTQPAHPILTNVKIDANLQMVKISGFDLSVGIQSQFTGDIEEIGSIAIPAKLLSDVISKIPESDVTLDDTKTGEYLLTISSGTTVIKIQGCSADEFPDLPIEQGASYKFPVDSFLAGINGSIVACSQDETKYILQGVNLKVSAQTVTFAATDGHRIGKVVALSPSSTENHISEEYQLTIPSVALQRIRAMLGKAEKLEMRYSSDQITFQSEDWLLTSRILDGIYPNYESLIGTKFERSIALSRLTLIKSLERLSIFASHENLVKLAINSETSNIRLSTSNELGSNGIEEVHGNISGTSIDVAFNIKYLLEGLKTLVTDTILMKMNGNLHPVVFSTTNYSPEGLYLVMPVQLRE